MRTLFVIAVTLVIRCAQAIQPEPLYSFQSGPSYAMPSLIKGTDGALYGTTYGTIAAYGGASNDLGTVFRLTTHGVLTTLVSFNRTNGAYPRAPLVLGRDGNFYGTTFGEDSGSNLGTVFRLTTDGVLTSLISFNGTNGAHPLAAPVVGNDGNLYGTTYGDDAGNNLGTVFRLTTNGVLTSLVSFNRANGAHPLAALVVGNDGNLYGTTEEGGGLGTVFKLTTNGLLTTLVSFTNFANGAYPTAPLVLGEDGNFYGTTSSGGSDSSGWGTVFQMTTNGVLRTLVSFNGANGAYPIGGLVLGRDANLYGTTVYGGSGYRNDNNPGDGTVFQVSAKGVLTTLCSFSTNGSRPFAPLLLGTDGNFYGTTLVGPLSGGTIFRLVTSPEFANATPQPGGHMLLSGTGLPNSSYLLWATPDLSKPFSSWTFLISNSFDSSGHFSYTDAAVPGNNSRFYRLSVP